MKSRLRLVSWVFMAVVVAVALAYAVGDDGGPRTDAERAAELSRTIACPQCSGQAVAESNAPIAEIISADIKDRVDAGESDAEIRAFYVEQYGEWVNLKPSGEGFDAWVWIAPFLVIGAAAGGLGVAFARWRDRHPEPVSDGERAAVAAATRTRTTGESRRMATRLDPDALAALEDERAFLLGSLDDLDAELAAGDLTAADHANLRDDYTRRAAEVINAIDEERLAYTGAPRLSGRQIVAWVAGLALVGAVAGFAVARSSGTRLEGEVASGDIRASSITKLNQARALFGDTESWDEAIELYDEVLDEQPSNVEAITYRGWLLYRQGAAAGEVLEGWDEAVRLDPAYPDVRVFRATAFADSEQWDQAAAELEAFDDLDPPEQLQALVRQQGLRGEIVAETRYDELVTDSAPSLDELDLPVLDALLGAEALLQSERPDAVLAALKLYEAVLVVAPEEPEALLGKAFILTEAGLVDEALAVLVVYDALDPESVPPALTEFADRLRESLN